MNNPFKDRDILTEYFNSNFAKISDYINDVAGFQLVKPDFLLPGTVNIKSLSKYCEDKWEQEQFNKKINKVLK